MGRLLPVRQDDVRLDVSNSISISRMRNAIDASRVAGRSSPYQRGCHHDETDIRRARLSMRSPQSLLGCGGAYRKHRTVPSTAIRENVAAATTQGDLFSLPGARCSWPWRGMRDQKLNGGADAISPGGFLDPYTSIADHLLCRRFLFIQRPGAGAARSTSRRLPGDEYPLLRSPRARAVELNGRRASHSLLVQWRGQRPLAVGTPGRRARTGKSFRKCASGHQVGDIRAPNLSELFGRPPRAAAA